MDGCSRRRRRRISLIRHVIFLCALASIASTGVHAVGRVGRQPGPTAAPECALIPDPGNCQGFFRRFYYDRWTGRCAMFIYSGCKGVVPFLIHKQCEEAKCYLMFPERNLRDLRSNSWFRMGRTVTKQEKSLDENAFHISSVRATVVIT